MVFARFFQRRIAVSLLSILIFSIAGPTAASATALNLYWRGGHNASSVFENATNWLVNSLTGAVDTEGPVGGDDVLYFMNNNSGSSLIGKNVWIQSKASVKGMVIHKNMTGTILLGSGSLNFGSSGIRMGSGRLIGSGHLLGGESNISGSGSFTMTGGIVRLGATNLYLSGSIAITKGVTSSYTEFVSTGTIMLNSRIADQNITMGPGVTGSLKNLTINNTAGGTSDDIIVDASYLALSGALTITRGNLDLAANNAVLLVEGGITLAANEQSTLTSDQNVTASGNIVAGAASAFILSSDTFTLNGKNQNFDTNNSPLYNLTIGSSGTATLTSDQSVTNILQINTGSTLDLNGSTIYATGAAIINYGTITEGSGKIEHSASTVKITDSDYAEDDAFTSGQVMYFTVTDSDENIAGTAADTLTVTVSGGSDTETVTLTETTKTSGIFRGHIDARASTSTTNIAVSAQDGTFEANEDVTVTLTYADAQDGESTTDTTSLTASVPTTTSTGGSGTGGGGTGRRSVGTTTTSVTTPATLKSIAPATTLSTLKARVEARKQVRLAMLKRAADRAAKRRAKWGL